MATALASGDSGERMRAVVQSAYGGPEVYSLSEVPVPKLAADQVLVRVVATSLHPDVWHVMAGLPYVMRAMGSGWSRPTQPIPCTDMAGVVHAVGAAVTQYRVGDEVYGEVLNGHQWQNGGTAAEYVATKETALAKKPAGLSFEEAAALPTAGLIAHQVVVTEGQVQAGQHVLVNGAGGGVGSLAVQLALALGGRVTAVDQERKREFVTALGVERFIDFAQQDYTQGEVRYDTIIDVAGNHPFSRVRRVLTPTGIYVMVGHDHFGATGVSWFGCVPRALGLTVASLWERQLPGTRAMFPDPTRWSALHALAEAGKLRPHLDRTFPMQEFTDAMRYLTSGAAVGRIVMTW